MGEGLAALIKSKEGKIVFLVLGGAVLILTGMRHLEGIKLSRLQRHELESKLGKNDQG